MYRFCRTIIFLSLNSLVKLFLEVFVVDKHIRAFLKGKCARLYLSKYAKIAYNKTQKEQTQKYNETKILWQFWEQGLDNAPDIVKACVKSVEQNKNDYKHVVLSMNNLPEHVVIPQLFYDLKEKGIIKSAHFSDIVRTYLLEQNGGVWLDATLYLQKPIPDYILNSEIFMFQNNPKIDIDGLSIASYFIVSKKHNTLLKQAEKVFEEYWKENAFLNNYFMFLHSFSLLIALNKEVWKSVPFFSFIPVQIMQEELLEPFNKNRLEEFKDMSFVHKLTYKRKCMGHKEKVDFSGTLYEQIVKGDFANE